jgi:hypothetical protein
MEEVKKILVMSYEIHDTKQIRRIFERNKKIKLIVMEKRKKEKWSKYDNMEKERIEIDTEKKDEIQEEKRKLNQIKSNQIKSNKNKLSNQVK